MEDKDLTPIDFITDHLINFDGIFDKHNNGDNQKPHQPIHSQHYQQIIIFQTLASYVCKMKQTFFEKEKAPIYAHNFITSDYISKIIRPPVFA